VHLLADIRLTDPTLAAIRDALKRACAAANARRKTGVVNLNDTGTKTLGNRVLREPGGVYTQQGTYSTTETSQLVLSWWTAPGGRKLLRVRAWRKRWAHPVYANPRDPVGADRREFTSRPAVWHLDPERMTMVEADGATECIAVCGCGAAGSPESLAWAGGMCGPCRDRVEEEGPESVAQPPALLTDSRFSPWGVAFAPDGLHLAAFAKPGHRVWDVTTGKPSASGGADHHNTRLATPPFGPDGRLAVLLSDHNALVCLAGPKWRTECRVELINAQSGAFWTGRPGELLAQDYWDTRSVRLLRLPDGQLGKPVRPPRPNARLVALFPDPKHPRAVFADSGNVAVSRVGRTGELTTEHEFRLGVGQWDRTGNWGEQVPKLVRFTADGERLLFVAQRSHVLFPSQLVNDEYVELWNPARPKALVQATFPARIRDAEFSPDGEHLFVLAEDGALWVCHPGLLTHVRARLRWHSGQVHSLAVSPDSRTVATAGDEGVKLWPVARLLEVL
jgi:hypothetical protein